MIGFDTDSSNHAAYSIGRLSAGNLSLSETYFCNASAAAVRSVEACGSPCITASSYCLMMSITFALTPTVGLVEP